LNAGPTLRPPMERNGVFGQCPQGDGKNFLPTDLFLQVSSLLSAHLSARARIAAECNGLQQMTNFMTEMTVDMTMHGFA
jgi:hypothetical protein